jgi:[acyl-carrier-protein] S-malonyltransferase
MGADFRRASAAAERTFLLAEAVTGLPLGRLCEEGPLERLTPTEVAQPTVVATSLAGLAVLRESFGDELRPAAVAGHSVGEWAAACAAGCLDEGATLELVHVRAQAMAAACRDVDGTMAAVLGLELAEVEAVCAASSDDTGTVQVANVNAPGQVVVAGERAAVERASAAARAAGARRVLPLPVGGPFHSRYMAPAQRPVADALAAVPFADPSVPIAANASGEALRNGANVRAELCAQIAAPVDWVACLRRLAALGCDRFLEVGPGEVLAGLVKRTLPGSEVQVASFQSPADLDAAAALVRD